ncbi:hypothetical protein F2P79_020825 [Pimephales promelas]|nr:hypothetical protein F2P79_020825 [Pimephales promelas]
MGAEHNKAGLFTTVHSPSRALSSTDRNSSEYGNSEAAVQMGHRTGTSFSEQFGVLQLLFSRTQEGRSPKTHLRSETFEQSANEKTVQNAYDQENPCARSTEGLIIPRHRPFLRFAFDGQNEDALAKIWPSRSLYAFPTISLLPKVIKMIWETHHSVLPIPPHWENQIWFPELTRLSQTAL